MSVLTGDTNELLVPGGQSLFSVKWSHYWGALTKWNNNAAGSRMSLESAALPEGPCEFVSPGEISLQIRPQTLQLAYVGIERR